MPAQHEGPRLASRERHILEVLYGLPPDAPEGTKPRPEFAPTRHSLAQCERAKAAELTAAGHQVSANRYLHNRTDGMIGALSHAIRGAAIDAILKGSERVTTEGLDAIPLDRAAESVRSARKPTRQR